MPIADINIEEIIVQHTDSAIVAADFSLLRKYLLEKKPLALITTPINDIISSHFSAKEQAFRKATTQASIDQQMQQDADEQSLDEKAKKRDETLKEEYSRSLPIRESQLQSITTQYLLKDSFYKQICSQLADLESNLRQNAIHIDSVVTERQAVHAKIKAALETTNPNVHSHAPTHEHATHTHTHPAPSPVHNMDGEHHVHTHSQEHVTHSHPATPSIDQLNLDRLIREERALQSQRQVLEDQRDRKNAEKNTEHSILQRILKEKSQIKEEVEKLHRALEIEIPEKVRNREVRLEARSTRQMALSHTNSDIQDVLSPDNYNALQKLLRTKAQQHAVESAQLVATVAQKSYPVYLTQLESRLRQEKGLKIASQERQTLNQILNLMNNFQVLANSEQLKRSLLAEKQSHLVKLEAAVTQNEMQLKYYHTSNTTLLGENERLDEESSRLSNAMASAKSAKKGSIVTAIVSGISCAIITAIFFDSLMLTPVYFAMPAAVGLVAIIGTIIAIAKYVAENGYIEHIESNIQTKTQNLETITRQKQEIITIQNSTIPNLQLQIKAAKSEIVTLDAELKTLQKQMSQLNIHAERLGTSAKSYSFFSEGNSSGNNVAPPAYAEATGYAAPAFFTAAESTRAPSEIVPSAPPAYGQQG